MKQLLNDLQTRLISAVPALRYVDFNNGQLEQDSPPVQWPCALIDIPSTEWSNQRQTADLAGSGWVFFSIIPKVASKISQKKLNKSYFYLLLLLFVL